MARYLSFVITWSTLAGCSLIYSPNNLPSPPGEAGVNDAEIILDADPRMLVIDDVSPSTIYEGQGDFGSQPAVVVLHGHQIIDSATTVEITPTTGAVKLVVGPPVVAKNGNWIALQVTAHVDPMLQKGTRIDLDVKVTETIPATLGGGTSTSTLSGKLTLTGLKELTNATMPEVVGTDIHTAMLEPLYSMVDLSMIPTARFIDPGRAIVHAVSSITTAALTADGAKGGAGATVGVAGGCDGAAPASTGGCDSTSGGKAGLTVGVGVTTAGAGGGGGFASDGVTATGASAGAGGTRTGDELIVTYEGFAGHTRNRAAGGGGGGGATLGTGGGGGASGGSIELTAGGNLTVGAISAKGGDGGGATGTGAGGGGGGAGGLVMLRADGALVSGAIAVPGGIGAGNGGPGSGGRVRWDAQTGASPTLTGASATLHRGPAFAQPMRIFRTPYAMLSVIGKANDQFNFYTVHAGVTNTDSQVISISPDGTRSFLVTLQQGFTHVCLTLAGGQQGTDEADKCIDVAFLP